MNPKITSTLDPLQQIVAQHEAIRREVEAFRPVREQYLQQVGQATQLLHNNQQFKHQFVASVQDIRTTNATLDRQMGEVEQSQQVLNRKIQDGAALLQVAQNNNATTGQSLQEAVDSHNGIAGTHQTIITRQLVVAKKLMKGKEQLDVVKEGAIIATHKVVQQDQILQAVEDRHAVINTQANAVAQANQQIDATLIETHVVRDAIQGQATTIKTTQHEVGRLANNTEKTAIEIEKDATNIVQDHQTIETVHLPNINQKANEMKVMGDKIEKDQQAIRDEHKKINKLAEAINQIRASFNKARERVQANANSLIHRISLINWSYIFSEVIRIICLVAKTIWDFLKNKVLPILITIKIRVWTWIQEQKRNLQPAG